jgi:ribose transport system ATP-binding protein
MRETRLTDTTPLLSATNVSKTFGGRPVLRNVDLTLRRGEVHGLLGANGSGKSTLIKILAGYHHPDPGGRIEIDGREVAFPLKASDGLGMSFVHQELALVGDATITENLRLGRYETGVGWRVSWREERRKVADSLHRFGIAAGPDTLAGELRPVEQALVAILRALEELGSHNGGILVLDEPTAYLPRDGVGRLFDAVHDIAAQGFGVLFVSHRLDEVRALTDRVSVLRDGALVLSTETDGLSEKEMVNAIVGFELEDLYPEPGERPVTDRALTVQSLDGRVARDVSFELRKGEIVGLTGLVGMGWEEVPYLLFGAESSTGGTIKIAEAATVEASTLTPRRALSQGIALLPADRRRDSGVGDASATENLTLPTLARHFIGGRLRTKNERRHAIQKMRDYQVSPLSPGAALGTFSGGNQQKVLLAKWLDTAPAVLMLHEPTQGVDVGARKNIFGRIQRAASEGTAVLFASAEYEDLAHLCDRVLVFRHGRIAAELEGDALTQDRIVDRSYRDASTTGEGVAR